MLKYNLSQIDSLSKKILSFLSKSDCIFLFGELGSGKTTFVRSLIHQLQEKNKIKKQRAQGQLIIYLMSMKSKI